MSNLSFSGDEPRRGKATNTESPATAFLSRLAATTLGVVIGGVILFGMMRAYVKYSINDAVDRVNESRTTPRK